MPDDLPRPDVGGEDLFTYNECWGQVEPSMRIHRFVMLPDRPEEPMAMFYRRAGQAPGAWCRRDLDKGTTSRILHALAGICLPLDGKVRSRTTMHLNSSLRIHRQGVSIDLWWDSADSELGDAVAPLMEAIVPLVRDSKMEIEKQEKALRLTNNGER